MPNTQHNMGVPIPEGTEKVFITIEEIGNVDGIALQPFVLDSGTVGISFDTIEGFKVWLERNNKSVSAFEDTQFSQLKYAHITGEVVHDITVFDVLRGRHQNASNEALNAMRSLLEPIATRLRTNIELHLGKLHTCSPEGSSEGTLRIYVGQLHENLNREYDDVSLRNPLGCGFDFTAYKLHEDFMPESDEQFVLIDPNTEAKLAYIWRDALFINLSLRYSNDSHYNYAIQCIEKLLEWQGLSEEEREAAMLEQERLKDERTKAEIGGMILKKLAQRCDKAKYESVSLLEEADTLQREAIEKHRMAASKERTFMSLNRIKERQESAFRTLYDDLFENVPNVSKVRINTQDKNIRVSFTPTEVTHPDTNVIYELGTVSVSLSLNGSEIRWKNSLLHGDNNVLPHFRHGRPTNFNSSELDIAEAVGEWDFITAFTLISVLTNEFDVEDHKDKLSRFKVKECPENAEIMGEDYPHAG